MQIYNGTYGNATTTTATLTAAQIAHPEIIQNIVQSICNQYSYTFTGIALGYGRYVTEDEIKKNTDKLTIANNNVQWAVMPRVRERVTLGAQINSGVGGSGAAFTMTLNTAFSWVRAGMVMKYYYAATGQYILFLVLSGPTANGADWDYSVKIVSSASATTPAAIPVDSELGFSTIMQASCTEDTTAIPTRYPDQYKNYNTIMKPLKQICKDGVATVTWFKADNGEMCWTPIEEAQFEQESLLNLEQGVVYGKSTVNASDVVYVTDAAGNSVIAGDGILQQIASGNIFSYNINDYEGQPANYATLLADLQDEIVDWSILNGITDTKLMVYAGTKLFALLQQVLADQADQSGGCCFVDYRSGNIEEAVLNRSISKYRFAGFEFVLLKATIFDNPGIQSPDESYTGLIMPDSDCLGNPLIKLFFRGGCGLKDVWLSKYIAGSISPMSGYGRTGQEASNTYSGYKIFKEVEYNVIVTDPSKLIWMQPFRA